MAHNASRFGITLQGVEPPKIFQQQVRDLEEVGFTHLWVTDSSLHARYVYEYLTLAALNSQSLQLGTGVTHPFTRHPATTVNAIATLDEISEGRAMLGVGAGDSPTAELGFRPARVQVVREMIEVARKLMAGETLDYENSTFRLANAQLHYKHRDRVPIYIACSGPKMLELAGEVADGVIVQCGVFPQVVDFALEHIGAGAARAGRNLEDIEIWMMACGAISEDRAQGIKNSRVMAAWFAQKAPHLCALAGNDSALVKRIQHAFSGGEFHEAQRAAALVPDEMVAQFTLGGTAEDARARIDQLVAHGVTRLNFMPVGANRAQSIQLFEQNVMQ
jgi:5,10-methylenetetrahydromethanopterin reductase